MMFSWHRTFSLGLAAPWRKAGKKKMPPESEVVLTNMKMLSNEYPLDLPVPDESPGPPRLFHTDAPSAYKENDSSTDASQSNSDYVSAFSDLAPVEPSCQRRGLYKFESEDSGVELPSGANSPSTPTGSEQSFVVHSRDSSCDSGVLSASSSPAIDHIAIRTRKDPNGTSECIQDAEEPGEECNTDLTESSQNPADTFEGLDISSEIDGQNLHFAKSHENFEKELNGELEFPQTENPSAASGVDLGPVSDAYGDTFDGLQEMDLHGQLKRYPTSDSLDEYMDECCRLSEVNQGSAKALGSGLGYLEHICQLIEKIGQLQEHNLRLQKQICCLQKEKQMKQMKEEYFAQHCSCGAARALRNSYQEVKKHFNARSRPHSMFIQSGNLSDLSMIPEMGGNYENLSVKGSDSHREPGRTPLILGLSETASARTTYEENDVRHMWSRTDSRALSHQDLALRRVENHPWGRVRDLVKKTKLKNQNKLGLSSMALKRSCPQLYRPDITSSDLRKKERNSMIVLGQNPKNDNAWHY